jgi:hypothetical protein
MWDVGCGTWEDRPAAQDLEERRLKNRAGFDISTEKTILFLNIMQILRNSCYNTLQIISHKGGKSLWLLLNKR